MEKFATAFAVPITPEQYKEVIPELVKLGYKDTGFGYKGKFLVSNFYRQNGEIGTVIGGQDSKFTEDRIVLPEFNKDLVLALAAMTTTEGFLGVGEWHKSGTTGKLCNNPFGVEMTLHPVDRKPTAEELIAHFSPKPEFLTPDQIEKLKNGWTIKMIPPAEYWVDLGADDDREVVLQNGLIKLSGYDFPADALISFYDELPGALNGVEPGILVNSNVFYTLSDLYKIIVVYRNLYGS